MDLLVFGFPNIFGFWFLGVPKLLGVLEFWVFGFTQFLEFWFFGFPTFLGFLCFWSSKNFGFFGGLDFQSFWVFGCFELRIELCLKGSATSGSRSTVFLILLGVESITSFKAQLDSDLPGGEGSFQKLWIFVFLDFQSYCVFCFFGVTKTLDFWVF